MHRFLIKFLIFMSIPLYFVGCIKATKHFCAYREREAEYDKASLYQNIALPTHPLTLDEIIEIGLERNLALLVKAQEYAVQREVMTAERLGMIPDLIGNIEWNQRDNNPGSSSKSLDPGVPPAPPSVSSLKNTGFGDVTLTWNLLDFGLSYYKARQEANNALIKQFEYKKLRQNLVLDIVKQYWLAVASKQGIERAKRILEKTEDYIERVQSKIKRRILSKVRALKMKDQLVDIQLNMKVFQKDYDVAIGDLKQLMGIPPSVEFDIEINPPMPETANLMNPRLLEEIALRQRPELFTYDIQEKIDIDEVRSQILRMIPGVSLFGSFFYNDNPFLIRNTWVLVGARASWNLFKLPRYRSLAKVGKKKKCLTRRNRLVMAMGALSQVNIAYFSFYDDIDRYKVLIQKSDVKEELFAAGLKQKELGKIDDADLLEIQVEALEAYVEKLKAYGQAQVSLEQINNAIGLPRHFKTF